MAILYLVAAFDIACSVSPVAAEMLADQPGGVRKCVRTVLGGKDLKQARICGHEIRCRSMSFRYSDAQPRRAA